MAVRVLIADSDSGHGNLCKTAIITGGLGDELITSQTDRDFSGETNWQNSGLSGFTTNGNLELGAYDVGVGYCYLANTNFNISVGKKYLLEYEVVYELDAGWDLYIGTQVLGKTGTSVGVHTVEFTLTIDGTGADGIKLIPGTYSAVFDNFSLKEMNILSSEIEVVDNTIVEVARQAQDDENIVAVLRSYALTTPTQWNDVIQLFTKDEKAGRLLYPRVCAFYPLGSNTFQELTNLTNEEPPIIITSGAGDTEAKNNTGYGKGLEFWDDDLTDADPADLSSYSNGVVLGKLLRIKDTLECTWWEARYRARATATQTEDNRLNLGWDLYNGYGKINVANAIAYKGVIPLDPYIYPDDYESEIEELEADLITANATIAELEASDAIMSPYFDDTNIRTGFEDTGNAETEDVESSRISSFSFEDGIVNCKLKLYTDADTFAKDNTAYIAKIDGNEGLITLNNFLYNWVKNNTSRLTSLTFKTQTK